MAVDAKDDVIDDLDDEELEPGSGDEKDASVATGSEGTKSGDETVATTVDPEREKIRAERRLEKKERVRRQREAIVRRDREIAGLKSTVADLTTKYQHLADRSQGSDMARVDTAIDSAAQEIEISSAAMEEAMKAGDPKIFREAQDTWYSARRKHEELTGFKRQVANARSQNANGGAVRTAQPDPELLMHARGWMANNKWYDANLGDEDSRIAHVIDQGLAREGYDPRTREYWDELTDRVKERLPRKFAEGGGTGGGGGGNRQTTGSGSGRESPGGSARITISKERIDAMKEAGIDWDDPKVRSRMIQRFQATDKELNPR